MCFCSSSSSSSPPSSSSSSLLLVSACVVSKRGGQSQAHITKSLHCGGDCDGRCAGRWTSELQATKFDGREQAPCALEYDGLVDKADLQTCKRKTGGQVCLGHVTCLGHEAGGARSKTMRIIEHLTGLL